MNVGVDARGVFCTKKNDGDHFWNPSLSKKKSGAALLSHTKMCSTIAAETLNNRVREGNECDNLAIGTGKIWNKEEMQSGRQSGQRPRCA